MAFEYLEEVLEHDYSKIFVIDRTLEYHQKKYYFLGMTIGDSVKLYVLEEYSEKKRLLMEKYEEEEYLCSKDHEKDQRTLLKEDIEYSDEDSFMNCRKIIFGNLIFLPEGSTGCPLVSAMQDLEFLKVCFDLLALG